MPQAFDNRGQWRSHANYKRRVSNPAAVLTHNPQDIYPKSVVRFVECRALLGGVTTTQGLTLTSIGGDKAYYEGLVRNVEFPNEPGWPVADDYINDFKDYQDAEKHYGPVVGDMQRPYIIHLAEGIDQQSRDYFQSFKKPDGSWLIAKNLIAIHAAALQAPEFQRMSASGGIVWSPLSNLLLYGDTTSTQNHGSAQSTADANRLSRLHFWHRLLTHPGLKVGTRVRLAAEAGISIALGSDWGPSGTKNLLGELKFAKLVSDHLGGIFTDRDLVRMVTSTPAAMLGWDRYVGSIEPGKIADLLVIAGTNGNPYLRLIKATETDVVAVVIDGLPRAGRATIIDPRTLGVELLRVAQQDMVLDIIESSAHPLAGIRLGAAIATLTYGLAHLPELATRFTDHARLMAGGGEQWMLRLEMDEEFAMSLRTAAAPIGPGDVDPMKLDPITLIDDADFIPRLKANPNLPGWLKQQL